MILISKTYEIVTHESAQDGESAENGFEFENVEYSFRELVEEMRNYSEPSQMPNDGNTHVWLTSEAEQDYQTGDYTSYSLHYSRENKPRHAKYWKWAMHAAGFIK